MIKPKLWEISKTQVGTELKNSNCDETQKLNFWQNVKTQIVIKQILWEKKLKTWVVTTKIATKLKKTKIETKI